MCLLALEPVEDTRAGFRCLWLGLQSLVHARSVRHDSARLGKWIGKRTSQANASVGNQLSVTHKNQNGHNTEKPSPVINSLRDVPLFAFRKSRPPRTVSRTSDVV